MFNLSVQHAEHYHLVVVSGDVTEVEVYSLIDFIAQLGQRSHKRTVIIDLMSVEHALVREQLEPFGDYIFESLGDFSRVAVALPLEFHPGFAMDVARERGLDIRAFHDLQPAIDWVAQTAS